MSAREQVAAVRQVLDAVTEIIDAEPVLGVPGGTIYAALMHFGCTVQRYEQIMDVLVQAGRIRKRGELYFPARAVT